METKRGTKQEAQELIDELLRDPEVDISIGANHVEHIVTIRGKRGYPAAEEKRAVLKQT